MRRIGRSQGRRTHLNTPESGPSSRAGTRAPPRRALSLTPFCFRCSLCQPASMSAPDPPHSHSIISPRRASRPLTPALITPVNRLPPRQPAASATISTVPQRRQHSCAFPPPPPPPVPAPSASSGPAPTRPGSSNLRRGGAAPPPPRPATPTISFLPPRQPRGEPHRAAPAVPPPVERGIDIAAPKPEVEIAGQGGEDLGGHDEHMHVDWESGEGRPLWGPDVGPTPPEEKLEDWEELEKALEEGLGVVCQVDNHTWAVPLWTDKKWRIVLVVFPCLAAVRRGSLTSLPSWQLGVGPPISQPSKCSVRLRRVYPLETRLRPYTPLPPSVGPPHLASPVVPPSHLRRHHSSRQLPRPPSPHLRQPRLRPAPHQQAAHCRPPAKRPVVVHVRGSELEVRPPEGGGGGSGLWWPYRREGPPVRRRHDVPER